MGVYLADSLKKLRLLVSVAAAANSSAEAILAQTDRILASQYFARSPALSRFLRFVVEQALQDKADELKEYRLGVDVFERGADFENVHTQAVFLQLIRFVLKRLLDHEAQKPAESRRTREVLTRQNSIRLSENRFR